MKRRNRVAILNILSTLLLNGISLITAPLFSRLLGTSGYGVLSVYTTWTSVIAIVFTLQTYGTLVNATVEYDAAGQKKYQSSIMSMSMLAYAGCSGLVVIFIKPLSGLLKLEWYLILLMLLQAFGTFCVNSLTTKFIYEFKAGWNMLISVGVAVVTLVLSLAFVLNLPHETRYLGRIVAIAATYGAFGIPACLYILAKGRTFYNREYWKFCVTLAIPSVFYNLSDLVLGQSDRVMLQQMLSEGIVGQYSLALLFAGVMFMLFGALNHTWCPYFFEDIKLGRKEAMEERTKNFLELFTVLSVGFLLLSREVYHFFAGPEYWDATVLIPIFVTSYYINFLCTFPVNFEYYRKQTKVVAMVTIASSLFNLALNYFLILRMGMLGAALATSISHGLQLILHYSYTRYFLGKKEYPFVLRLWLPYAACYACILVLVVLLPGAWFLRWPIGAAIGVWELLRIRKRKVLI